MSSSNQHPTQLAHDAAANNITERNCYKISFEGLSVTAATAVEPNLKPADSEDNKKQLEKDLKRGLQLGDYKWPSPDNLSKEAHRAAVKKYVSNILDENISQEVLNANPGLDKARELAKRIIPYYSQNLSYVAYRVISPSNYLSHTDLSEMGQGESFSIRRTDKVSTERFYFDESGEIRFSSSMRMSIASANETEIESLGIIGNGDTVDLDSYLTVDMAYGDNVSSEEELIRLRKQSLTITIENEEVPQNSQKSMLRSLLTDDTPKVSAYIHEQFKSVASETPALMRRYAPELLVQLKAYEDKKREFEGCIQSLLAQDEAKRKEILQQLSAIDEKVEQSKKSFKDLNPCQNSIGDEKMAEFKAGILAAADEMDNLEREYFPELSKVNESIRLCRATATEIRSTHKQISTLNKILRLSVDNPKLLMASSEDAVIEDLNLAKRKFLKDASTDSLNANFQKAIAASDAEIEKFSQQKEELQKKKEGLIYKVQAKCGLTYCIKELDKKIKELEGRIILKADPEKIEALKSLRGELESKQTNLKPEETIEEVIARHMKKNENALNKKAKIFGIFTMPFFSSGKTKTEKLLDGLEQRAKTADAIIAKVTSSPAA